MKFKKRGAVEVQFNWIFVLIAGSVILLFFGSIIMKQRSASEQRLSASLLSDLESIMSGSIVTEQALNFISIPKKDINFKDCDFYYIGKKDEADVKLKKDIKEKIIFAPDVIRGTKLTIWTLPWDVPYKVTNFLYLTSPQVRYVFVHSDPSFFGAIDELLPEDPIIIDEEEYTTMFRQGSPSMPVTDLNNYKVKFVFLNQDPSGDLSVFNNMKDDDVRAIKIIGDIDDGSIIFYKKRGNGFVEDGSASADYTSYYYGKASLIGAIFAEDKDMYECAMQNAFQRMNVVSDVYYQRTNNLVGTCSYSNFLSKLDNLRTASGTVSDVVDIIKNNQLPTQDKNCPLVY